ncbi:MAG: hypothetical protein WKF37_11085 [Bryobacteraceae bacterium]
MRDSASPYDLRLEGKLNLGVLRSFDEDVVSSGAAVVNASVRGSLKDPQVSGRLELKNASLYLTSLPNGLDQANAQSCLTRDGRRSKSSLRKPAAAPFPRAASSALPGLT